MLTVALIVVIVSVAASVVIGEDGVAHLVRLHRERQQLSDRAVRLMHQNTALAKRIHDLRTDDRALEAIARRELGLVRPGEIVYRFDTAETESP